MFRCMRMNFTCAASRHHAVGNMTGSMINRNTDLLRRVSPQPSEMAPLQEASDRLDQLIDGHFGGTVAQINGEMIAVHKGLVEKSSGLPELEVADFIMPPAGRRA
jgi:hypothetical protein